MRFKLAALIAALTLVLAACNGSEAAKSTTTAAGSGVEATTTTQSAPAPEEMLLTYSLSAGDTFVYEVVINQEVEMSSEGEGSSFGEEELPGSASVELTASGTFTFEVSDGPEPGTYAVTITSDLTAVNATGTVDGEAIDSNEAPEFAEIEPVSVTVVVDEQGNVIPDSPGVDDPFADLFGGMGAMGPGAVPGAELGQFFGAPFPDDEVAVGDTWSDTVETPGLGTEPITTSITSTVTEAGEVDGVEVLVVESDVVVDPFEFDLGEFFVGLFSGFLPDDATAEEQAEIDALVENLRFVMSFDESGSHSTTYFDPAAGISRQFDVTSSSRIGMDVNFPDEETGELMGFIMDMAIEQTVSHKLVDGPAA
ncbi:MAG: hypothetical protein WDZ96_01630 [Acidimicrobiia bacterium]